MKTWANDNGTPRELKRIWVNDAGTVRELKKMWALKGGTVTQVFGQLIGDWTNATQQARLIADTPVFGDMFGSSIDLSSNTIVIGVPSDDPPGAPSFNTDTGSAYIFTRTGTNWTRQAYLQPTSEVQGYFGRSVAIDGDTVVVGMQETVNGLNNAGSAYIFTRSGTTWTQQARLLPSVIGVNFSFGDTVAIDGDTVVVGAYGEDSNSVIDSGAVYVFTRSGTAWTQQARLVSPDPVEGGWFGYSLTITGDTIVIGAPSEHPSGALTAGAAYVFVRSGTTWTQQTKIVPTDILTRDNFGSDVAIDGNTVAISSLRDEPVGQGSDTNRGSVYVFTRSGTTWTQQGKLEGTVGIPISEFGRSIDIYGDVIVVGSIDNIEGTIYIFKRNGTSWILQKKITPGGADGFGAVVGVDGNVVIACNPVETVGNLQNAGAVYVYTP